MTRGTMQKSIMKIEGDEGELTRGEKRLLEICAIRAQDEMLKGMILLCIANGKWSEEIKNELVKKIDEVEEKAHMLYIGQTKVLLYNYVNSRMGFLSMKEHKEMVVMGNKTEDVKIIEMVGWFEKNKLFLDQKMVNELLEYIRANTDNNLFNEEAHETIEDILMKECEIDSKIERYTCYTTNKPAKYISFMETANSYYVSYSNLNKQSKKLSVLVDMLKSKLMEDTTVKWIRMYPCKMLEYGGNMMMLYIYESKIYFEVNHILKILGLEQDKRKYEACEKMAVIKDIRDNQYEGFYVKMYINQESLNKMLINLTSGDKQKAIKVNQNDSVVRQKAIGVRQWIEIELRKLAYDDKIVVDESEFRTKS